MLPIKNAEWKKRIEGNFDLYIEMIKNSEPSSFEFSYASDMLRHHIDSVRYNDIRNEMKNMRTPIAEEPINAN